MSRLENIKKKLEESFLIETLQIIDESELHRGHAGFQEGGESHIRIRLVSTNFKNKSRLECHRAVHAALGKQILEEIHALALELDVPC